MPTILIVDLSSTDLPDLRCWNRAFQGIWQDSDAYLAVGAMVSHTIRRIPTLQFSINPHADPSAVDIAASVLAASPVLADLAEQAGNVRR